MGRRQNAERLPKDVYFRQRLIESLENGNISKAKYYFGRLIELIEVSADATSTGK